MTSFVVLPPTNSSSDATMPESSTNSSGPSNSSIPSVTSSNTATATSVIASLSPSDTNSTQTPIGSSAPISTGSSSRTNKHSNTSKPHSGFQHQSNSTQILVGSVIGAVLCLLAALFVWVTLRIKRNRKAAREKNELLHFMNSGPGSRLAPSVYYPQGTGSHEPQYGQGYITHSTNSSLMPLYPTPVTSMPFSPTSYAVASQDITTSNFSNPHPFPEDSKSSNEHTLLDEPQVLHHPENTDQFRSTFTSTMEVPSFPRGQASSRSSQPASVKYGLAL